LGCEAKARGNLGNPRTGFIERQARMAQPWLRAPQRGRSSGRIRGIRSVIVVIPAEALASWRSNKLFLTGGIRRASTIFTFIVDFKRKQWFICDI
jgi:hypothetical protein